MKPCLAACREIPGYRYPWAAIHCTFFLLIRTATAASYPAPLVNSVPVAGYHESSIETFETFKSLMDGKIDLSGLV
jgi:hypothetical protein